MAKKKLLGLENEKMILHIISYIKDNIKIVENKNTQVTTHEKGKSATYKRKIKKST